MKTLEGRVWKLGNNIDADLIIPARYLHLLDRKEVAAHTLEAVIPGFASLVQPGDVLVAGSNIGPGSAREHAAGVLKELGLSCVIAESFARTFYRNCINLGLPPLRVADTSQIRNGEILQVDLGTGIIRNKTSDQVLNFTPFPAFIAEIIKNDGLVQYTLLTNSGKCN